MTAREYNLRNNKLEWDLLTEATNNPPVTQKEKDIFNLKSMLYNIKHGSRYYRWGYVATLKRAIKRLESEVKSKCEATLE